MADRFENLDNTSHDWANREVQKSTVKALNRYEKHSLAGDSKSISDSTFSAFSLRTVDFAVQFLLRCKFSFHEMRISC